jgi:hypothetical protein
LGRCQDVKDENAWQTKTSWLVPGMHQGLLRWHSMEALNVTQWLLVSRAQSCRRWGEVGEKLRKQVRSWYGVGRDLLPHKTKMISWQQNLYINMSRDGTRPYCSSLEKNTCSSVWWGHLITLSSC